jgi:catechol 2,3-dioxygenase-like lactoylglutathione lyase family enzyme
MRLGGQQGLLSLASVFVDDQSAALDFYTRVLGFRAGHDIPFGNGDRWLTVRNHDDEPSIELLLEPASHPAVGPYRDALSHDGIPATSFAVDDVDAEHGRLEHLGVVFTQPPTQMGPVRTAVFDDTCGNLIQIVAQ